MKFEKIVLILAMVVAPIAMLAQSPFDPTSGMYMKRKAGTPGNLKCGNTQVYVNTTTNDLYTCDAATKLFVLRATTVTGTVQTGPAGNQTITGGHTLANTGGFVGPLTGNADTATALAADGANCSAGQFPLGVSAAGAAQSCTALPTAIAGTANQVAASGSTGAVTLSIPTNPVLPGISSLAGNSVALTADWTCGTAGTVGDCSTAVIVGSGGGVPLTLTLPLAARSYEWNCWGVVGQATAATANSWNFITSSNAATNVMAEYIMGTAATASAYGAVTGSSVTTSVVISPAWTLGGTTTKMPFHVHGRIEAASASGTVISFQLVAPTVGDVVTIYRGASCEVR